MEFKLKDIAHINQETVKKDSFPNNFLYLDTKNLTNGKFWELAYFDSMKDKVPSRARRIVKENDILISTVRPNQRHYGFITKDQKSYIVSTGFAVITPEETKVNPYFLYKYLTLENITNYLQSIAENSTSAYPAIKPSVLSELSINLPDKTIQDYISNLLRSLDDKINLNEQIIANLEELSQTLFKRWFVDFEFPDENGNPYKSSGGEMIDSELGKIPKEWTVKPLNEFIDIIDNRGKTPPLVNEMRAHPIIDVKALSGDTRVIDYKKCLKFVSKETYDTWFRSGHPKKGDTLLSTVGSIGETKMFYHDIGTIAQNVVSLRSENSYFTYDLINNVKSSFLTFNIGSVQPSIKITHINKIKVVYPSKIVIENYEKMIKKFISNLYVRDLENQNLTQLRDTLLPKLMSGEIEIPDDIEVNEDELSI
ncbi:restriction endonuclease subunit S [Staphylococcus saprophyticus]|uniref:restriction endonuclease subunit S n=1 Tax=Staphylococcus saprophyticus TaxID=29385 RepID=UPI002DBCF308|nr:restriction endonuclease subunit S [Staphylococcus saprophyticus]MEB5701555.1 restriction endonuclease subunit S [Staphylococcus saprophyticus]